MVSKDGPDAPAASSRYSISAGKFEFGDAGPDLPRALVEDLADQARRSRMIGSSSRVLHGAQPLDRIWHRFTQRTRVARRRFESAAFCATVSCAGE